MEQLATSNLTKCNKDQINYPIKKVLLSVNKQRGSDDERSAILLFISWQTLKLRDGHNCNTIGHNLNFIDWSRHSALLDGQKVPEMHYRIEIKWSEGSEKASIDKIMHYGSFSLTRSYMNSQQLHNQASDDGKLKLYCI